MNQKNPIAPAAKAAAQPEKKKPTETLKVAYTRTDDGKAFENFRIFGTDDARSDFLRSEPDVWWRIADLAKGQSLVNALGEVGAR